MSFIFPKVDYDAEILGEFRYAFLLAPFASHWIND